jgi:hypothetical protein
MSEFINEVSLLLILFADSEGCILTGFIFTFTSKRVCVFLLKRRTKLKTELISARMIYCFSTTAQILMKQWHRHSRSQQLDNGYHKNIKRTFLRRCALSNLLKHDSLSSNQ